MDAERESQLFLSSLGRSEEVQARTLLETIVHPNVESERGRSLGFARISSVEEWQRAVPITDYEALRPAIDRLIAGEQGVLTTEPVRRFFLTSGSTARPKHVPVTSSFLLAKSRAFGIYWSLALAQHPGANRSSIATNFSDAGSDKRADGGGLPVSSESAYWSQVVAATQRRSRPLMPRPVARIPDAEARYYGLARVLLEEDLSGLMSLNPSTILLLFQAITAHGAALARDLERGEVSSELAVPEEARAAILARTGPDPARAERLRRALADAPAFAAKALWPSLSLIVSWRSPMLRPYLELLAPHLDGVRSRDYLSMASEGVLAIPIAPEESGGALAIGVHFYELIPLDEIERANPTVLLPHQVEVGKSYVIVLTTSSGLFRYNIGDVVRVVRFEQQTPVVEFLHRAGRTCSLTGEKLTEEQVTGAIAAAARALHLPLVSFTVHPAPSGFPRYVVLVETERPAGREALHTLATTFDRTLSAANLEYASKRESKRLGAPEVWRVAPGSYARHRADRIRAGTSDGQYKPTHLTRDSSFHQAFQIEEQSGEG